MAKTIWDLSLTNGICIGATCTSMPIGRQPPLADTIKLLGMSIGSADRVFESGLTGCGLIGQ